MVFARPCRRLVLDAARDVAAARHGRCNTTKLRCTCHCQYTLRCANILLRVHPTCMHARASEHVRTCLYHGTVLRADRRCSKYELVDGFARDSPSPSAIGSSKAHLLMLQRKRPCAQRNSTATKQEHDHFCKCISSGSTTRRAFVKSQHLLLTWYSPHAYMRTSVFNTGVRGWAHHRPNVCCSSVGAAQRLMVCCRGVDMCCAGHACHAVGAAGCNYCTDAAPPRTGCRCY